MYELKNHMESVAQQALKEYMTKVSLPCTCERCLADILALTLNQLPAKYYVSLKGEILTQWESQSRPDQAKVIAAVARAAKQVEITPSHS
ncbi:late competence development ComFB family protein [Desulfitobacterium metallireducens]|uniref:Late competence development protein ComFB n=1 Tax=Desulfitobacterium metallireducens DSM 15288 TaxID=871968 RepID=W0EB03_9FIRM|nr:late competence development ComFB family protein [Desulfitobacterium metallireducens]AHF06683.1 Late competence development protein ComFB [Desulfitobacterium metallireducens DSM 15288]